MRIVQTLDLLSQILYSTPRRTCEDSPSQNSVLITVFLPAQVGLKLQNTSKRLTYYSLHLQVTGLQFCTHEHGPSDKLSLPVFAEKCQIIEAMLIKYDVRLRTVWLLLRLKSGVYTVIHLKAGARCKRNRSYFQ